MESVSVREVMSLLKLWLLTEVSPSLKRGSQPPPPELIELLVTQVSRKTGIRPANPGDALTPGEAARLLQHTMSALENPGELCVILESEELVEEGLDRAASKASRRLSSRILSGEKDTGERPMVRDPGTGENLAVGIDWTGLSGWAGKEAGNGLSRFMANMVVKSSRGDGEMPTVTNASVAMADHLCEMGIVAQRQVRKDAYVSKRLKEGQQVRTRK